VPTKLLIAAVTANSVVGQLILKYALGRLGGPAAMENLPGFALKAATSPLIYASLAVQALGYLLWMLLISRVKLGVATAGVGASFYVCMAIAAGVIFGESLSYLQWVGIGLVTVGVTCIGLGSV
jgi:drug/metabolite transporter (DMT)-like permease